VFIADQIVCGLLAAGGTGGNSGALTAAAAVGEITGVVVLGGSAADCENGDTVTVVVGLLAPPASLAFLKKGDCSG
jgi:hypothetical protein